MAAKSWKDKYNTQLTAEEEKQFQKWAKENNRQNDDYDYDIRGAWKEITSGKMTEADNGHLGDKYKKPNHPTFSDQSIYSGKDGYVGGSWKEDNGTTSFTPSPTNLQNYSMDELRAYFSKVEPGVILNTPSYDKEVY